MSSVENSCEMQSVNDDVPARDAEGRTSFRAGKSAQSLRAQLGITQAVASPHIVPTSRQLDEEIPRDDDSVQEVEARDQGVPVVRQHLSGMHIYSGSRRK